MIQCFWKQTTATTGTGTRFHHPWASERAWSTVQDQHRTPIPAAGTIRNMRARFTSALAASSTRTLDIYHNGSITSLGVSIAAAASTTIHENIVNEVAVAAGDSIALGSTLTGTDANVTAEIALEFETTTNFDSVYGGAVDALSNLTAFHNIQSMDSTSGGALAIDDTQSVWPCAGTFTRWDMRLLTAPGGVTARHFVMFKNGTIQDGSGGTPDTQLTISGTSTTGSTTFSLSVSPGDLLSWRATVTGSPAGSTALPGFKFEATTAGDFVIAASDEDQVSSTVASYVTQTSLNWDTNEANVDAFGNITTFEITGWAVALSASDNGRTFQTRLNGSNAGPSGTLGGGATTLTGAGSPLVITSADTWTFGTAPGAAARNVLVGLIGNAQEALRPGPLVNGVLLRFSRVNGGMLG